MHISYTKMQGLSNDFVVINNMDNNIILTTDQVRYLCDRHVGVGADGVILVEKTEEADCFMNYINADGTYSEMCGNGIRCTAKFFQEKISPKATDLRISTRSGIKEIIFHDDGTYSVCMGIPKFIHEDFPDDLVNIEGFAFEFVSMGNPHAITVVGNVDKIDIVSVGPTVESDSHFPHKINVHFVEKISNNELKMRVWERGSGVTLACGTGACAVYALARKKGMIEEKANINLPGGTLIISSNEKGEIVMCGPASIVYKGDIEI